VIERLEEKNYLDVYDFLSRVEDRFNDFYITKEKNRLFFKNNWELIKKTLKYQECYGLFDNGLRGIIIILRDKGFRPYVKVLAENRKFTIDLLKWFKWNFMNQNLFFKLKKENPLSQMILKTGFIKIGDRGLELLFEKKAIKEIYKLTPKDDYLPEEKKRIKK